MTNQIITLLIKDKISAGILLLYITLFGMIIGLDQGGQILRLIKSIEHTQLARMASLLFLTCVFLIVLFLRTFQKNKIDINEYLFNEKSGLYSHIKSGQLVCTSCLLDKKIHSPVKETQRYWSCQINKCNRSYPNPEHNTSKAKRGVISKGVDGL